MNEEDGFTRMRRGFGGRRAAPLAGVALVTLMIAALGAGSMLTSAQSSTPTPCPSATPASDDTGNLCVALGEFDIYFKPNTATIPADNEVTFSLDNQGVTAHNFSITDRKNPGLKNLNISVDTNPGETSTTTVNAPEGDYYFFCNIPGHEAAGMFGYISVKNDAKISTAEVTVTPRSG